MCLLCFFADRIKLCLQIRRVFFLFVAIFLIRRKPETATVGK